MNPARWLMPSLVDQALFDPLARRSLSPKVTIAATASTTTPDRGEAPRRRTTAIATAAAATRAVTCPTWYAVDDVSTPSGSIEPRIDTWTRAVDALIPGLRSCFAGRPETPP